ncbi:MAG: ATP-binding cassette domain-containing protein [Deltaproteobacteria bacterium]|nr:ATP-binding cassette domain-containing protein [Deltaproteobacteria bacterium]
MLKCIYRTYIPTTGKIWFHSQDYGIIDLARIDESKMIQIREKEIGYISQFLKVIPRVPAIDIVSEPLLESGVPEGEARKMARDLLMRLRVPSNLYDAYPSTFSGGEQQRINIARAIIKKPRLLLLDEPTASLDQMSKKIVLRIFKELKEQGCTMIGIFHEKEILKKFSDQILTLHENGHYDIE